MQCFLCHGHELEYRRDDIGCEVTGCLTCGNEFYTKGQTIRHDARKEYRDRQPLYVSPWTAKEMARILR